jgi:hypothetical protein
MLTQVEYTLNLEEKALPSRTSARNGTLPSPVHCTPNTTTHAWTGEATEPDRVDCSGTRRCVEVWSAPPLVQTRGLQSSCLQVKSKAVTKLRTVNRVLLTTVLATASLAVRVLVQPFADATPATGSSRPSAAAASPPAPSYNSCPESLQ